MILTQIRLLCLLYMSNASGVFRYPFRCRETTDTNVLAIHVEFVILEWYYRVINLHQRTEMSWGQTNLSILIDLNSLQRKLRNFLWNFFLHVNNKFILTLYACSNSWRLGRPPQRTISINKSSTTPINQ